MIYDIIGPESMERRFGVVLNSSRIIDGGGGVMMVRYRAIVCSRFPGPGSFDCQIVGKGI